MKFLCIFLFIFEQAYAAGFIDNKNGTPYRWKQGVDIVYRVDPSALNNDISNAAAKTIIASAFNAWKSVSIVSGLNFVDAVDLPGGTNLPTDVTGTNYQDYVRINEEDDSFENVTDDTVVLLDADGTIFEDLFGGQSNFILGIASPGGFDEATFTITKGFAIINGAASGVDSDSVLATMTHEFGHMLNLAHTQLNEEEVCNGDISDDAVIPTMFPFLPCEDPTVLSTLSRDDEFSLAYLYPNPTNFAAQGSITGQILRRDEEGVRAVNVICRKKDNPRVDAVSWISDQVIANKGEYECRNLGTGSYTVEIQPITLAINFFDPDPPFIASEFYNGANESFDPKVDGRTVSQDVAVTEGGTTTGINIILNEDGRLISGQDVAGSASPLSISGYADLEYFVTIPPGASKVRFELDSKVSNVDIDLHGRCDQEFALTGDLQVRTSPPIFDLDPSVPQQSEFNGVEPGGVESVELSSESSPPLKECTYHLLVTNLSNQSVQFNLKATVEGGSPSFKVTSGGAIEVTDGLGEILVMSRIFSAEGETFDVKSLVVTDQGNGDLSRVSSVKLYADDGNGTITSEDRLVATATTIDTEKREITFSGLIESFTSGSSQTYLVTYGVGVSTSGYGILWVLLSIGFFFSALKNPIRTKGLVAVLGIFILSISCGGKGGYRATIKNKESIEVTGQTFGTSINISVEGAETESVKDFFAQ